MAKRSVCGATRWRVCSSMVNGEGRLCCGIPRNDRLVATNGNQRAFKAHRYLVRERYAFVNALPLSA